MSFFSKAVLTSLGLIFLALSSKAQIDSLVNSGEVIQSSRHLYDSGRYESAIKQLQRIDPRDTNYVYSLSELAKTYLENKNYQEAVAACEKGLAAPSPYRSGLFNTMARSLAAQGNYERSYTVINKALTEFPLDFSLVYRHAVILYANKKYPEAEAEFFKAIRLAPYLSGAHLYLGTMAMQRGNKVAGMMATGIYLVINNTANKQLQILERFVKNEITDENTIESDPAYAFARLDEIIRSKISFEEGYKTKIPIDAGIVKQYQLLFEQISNEQYPPNDPWVEFYVKIYKDIVKANMQEIFVYHLLESSPIKQVSQWKEKNKKSYQPFYDGLNSMISQFRVRQKLPAQWGFTDPVSCSYYDDGHLESIGNRDAKGKRTGKWYFFTKNGAKIADGTYKEDQKTGIWNFYNDSGIITNTENYETDVMTVYNNEGGIKSRYVLKEKGIDGKYELYYLCGALLESREYKQGQRHGPGKGYYPNGKLSTEFTYVDDSLHGKFTEWYETGVKMSEQEYNRGLNIGKFASYHPNGKVKAIGNYENGKASGQWLYYFKNGKLQKKGNYRDDEVVGIWEVYNLLGELVEKTNYGDSDGNTEENFYHNGKLHYSAPSKKGTLSGLTYYDKNEKVIATLSSEEGTFKGKGYFPTGELRVELEYLKGKRHGTWKYYYRYGALESQCEYRDGLLQGEYFEYYQNGALKIKSHYTDGDLDGYYVENHTNGSVKSSGWFVHGQKQQRWVVNYTNGKISSDSFFLNDIEVGYTLGYNEDGGLFSKVDLDEEGRIKMITHYDKSGAVASEAVKSDPKQLIVVEKYKSGKIAQETSIGCRVWNGITHIQLANGKTFKEHNFINDKLTGKYTAYFSDGRVEGTGQNEDGVATGTWIWYNEENNKYSEGKYLDGDKDSVWTNYYPNGQISNTTFYIENNKHDVSQLFAFNGQPMTHKKYDNGDLISYRVYDKAGKLSEWIPFKGNGTLISYFPSGQVAISEEYKNGEFDGVRTIYYPSGKILSQYRYRNGFSDGENFEYYPDGKLREKTTYKDDSATGVWEYYDSNGNITRRETYSGGALNGKTEYFSNGKSTGVQWFWGGIPID